MELPEASAKPSQHEHEQLRIIANLLCIPVLIFILSGAGSNLLMAQGFDKNKVSLQLDSMAVKDQALRGQLVKMDQHWHDSLQSSYDSLWGLQKAYDKSNMKTVDALNRRYGWHKLMQLGKGPRSIIFLIIQHSDSLHQIKYLPFVKASVQSGTLPGYDYALLKDRIGLMQQKKQYYGTQYYWDQMQKKYVPFDIIGGYKAAEKRRAALGMDSLAVYLELANRSN